MNDYQYIYKNSSAENLRLYILELTLQVESQVSKTLGFILDIDWQKSKSFGNSSTALSFNQKIQIIQDLKGLDKVDHQKLSDLMTIRNKFAHVLEIDTFESFFEAGAAGKDVKKNLDKWYSEKHRNFTEKEFEFKYKVFFHALFLDVYFVIIKKIGEHIKDIGQKSAELDILTAIKDEVLKLPNGNEIIDKVTEIFKKHIQP